MTDKIQKVTKKQGVISILVLAIISISAFTYILPIVGYDTWFRYQIVNSWWFYVPSELMQTIVDGGMKGIFFAVVISSLHVVLWIYFGILIVFLYNLARNVKSSSGSAVVQYPQFVQQTDPAGYYLRSAKSLTSVILATPSGRKIKNIASNIQMRLDRSKLRFNRDAKNPIEELEQAIIATLHKHRDWPADPTGHHSVQNLYNHSMAVSKALHNACKGHPLAKSIGLAHDIGKIFAYKRKALKNNKFKWEIISKRHDKLSAHIISLMPEFQKLDSSSQDTIVTVLSFSHRPEMLPQNKITKHEMILINKLREVDGLATKEDQNMVLDESTQDDIHEILYNAIVQYVLPTLNINSSRNEAAYADGWTNPGYQFIGVKESSLREGLKSLVGSKIDQKYAMAIGLETKIKHSQAYKATQFIIDSLISKDIIYDNYGGIPAHNGMYRIRAGTIDFNNIVLFKPECAENDMIEQWGECKFKLKVKQNFTRQYNQNESDPE